MSTPVPDERLLVVVAHPDDETFGCGSFIAHATERGVPTTVACATRGEAGSPAPDSGIGADDDLAAIREAELRAAAELLGVDRVVLFDWRDSGMDGEPEPGTLVAAPLDDVTATIGRLIDDVDPTIVVTLDGSDGHRDHAHVRDATVAATAERRPEARLYLHCLPRSLMARWAAELERREPGSSYLAVAELGTPEDAVTTVVDTTDLLERREAAIAIHRSQVSPYEIMPADLRAAFLSSERLRRVQPPWTGGDVERDVFAG